MRAIIISVIMVNFLLFSSYAAEISKSDSQIIKRKHKEIASKMEKYKGKKDLSKIKKDITLIKLKYKKSGFKNLSKIKKIEKIILKIESSKDKKKNKAYIKKLKDEIGSWTVNGNLFKGKGKKVKGKNLPK